MPPAVPVPRPVTGSLMMSLTHSFVLSFFHSFNTHYVLGTLSKSRGDLNMFSDF